MGHVGRDMDLDAGKVEEHQLVQTAVRIDSLQVGGSTPFALADSLDELRAAVDKSQYRELPPMPARVQHGDLVDCFQRVFPSCHICYDS